MVSGRLVVAVIDADDAVRRSTAALLARAGYQVRAFESGDAFLAAQLPGDSDCILLDMGLPGTSGLDVLKALGTRERMPPVLVLASHGAVPEAVEAMKLGAADILEKPCRATALLQAIGQALALQPRRKAGAVDPDAAAKVAILSQRQLQVLRGILKGQPNKAIARQLELSLRTVEVHRAQVFERLGVRGTAEAVRLAIAAGLLES
ncbi:MAG TPA: response regulator [Allosphingosinicella sp.]|nr:response regulator [Allosphingosinicella sp.]